jgi:hypothetical protein
MQQKFFCSGAQAHFDFFFIFNYTFLRTSHKSKWFKRINFIVTHFTSYFEKRPKYFADSGCEEHFYPRDIPSSTEVGKKIESLALLDFGALLFVCIVVVVMSVLSLLLEIAYSKYSRNSKSTILLPSKSRFSYQSKCGNPKSVQKKLLLLLHALTDDVRLCIVRCETVRIAFGSDVNLSIFLVFELNHLDKCDEILGKFDAFIVYLNSISH